MNKTLIKIANQAIEQRKERQRLSQHLYRVVDKTGNTFYTSGKNEAEVKAKAADILRLPLHALTATKV